MPHTIFLILSLSKDAPVELRRHMRSPPPLRGRVRVGGTAVIVGLPFLNLRAGHGDGAAGAFRRG